MYLQRRLLACYLVLSSSRCFTLGEFLMWWRHHTGEQLNPHHGDRLLLWLRDRKITRRETNIWWRRNGEITTQQISQAFHQS